MFPVIWFPSEVEYRFVDFFAMVSSRSSAVKFECSPLARVNQHITNCDSIDAIYESHKSLKFSVTTPSLFTYVPYL